MALSTQARKLRRAKLGNLWRDLVIIAAGVVITLLVVRMGALEKLLTAGQEQAYISSFIAGIFFTSIFTIAPASIVLAEMSQTASVTAVALWGALGAMLGDLLLFLFIRDVFSDDIESIIRIRKWKHWLAHTHFGFLRWLIPVIGALIIASPLPDEIGIALLGMSKTRTPILLPIAFAMNFLGILAVAAVASHL